MRAVRIRGQAFRQGSRQIFFGLSLYRGTKIALKSRPTEVKSRRNRARGYRELEVPRARVLPLTSASRQRQEQMDVEDVLNINDEALKTASVVQCIAMLAQLSTDYQVASNSMECPMRGDPTELQAIKTGKRNWTSASLSCRRKSPPPSASANAKSSRQQWRRSRQRRG